jgi:hypothetical protein
MSKWALQRLLIEALALLLTAVLLSVLLSAVVAVWRWVLVSLSELASNPPSTSVLMWTLALAFVLIVVSRRA